MKIQKFKKQAGSAHLILTITILAALLIGVLGYVFWSNFINKNAGSLASTNDTVSGSRDVETSESRDKLRGDHAAQFATSLFYAQLIQKESPESSQLGFESFAVRNGENPVTDPLTKRPYVFTETQDAMRVGEVTFRLYSSCDNKIIGSKNSGMIIDATPSSIAVAVKLESGTYACEANL